MSSNTFTTSSVILTKREEFILKFSDRAIITTCKRIIARHYSKSLKQLICVIDQAWGQNGWITIPTVAPFPFFSFLFWSTFRALSRHSLWSVSILFFNADSSPKTAPRPLQSAPTSSHMFKSYTTRGGCKTSTYNLNKNCDFNKTAIILIPNAIFDNNS